MLSEKEKDYLKTQKLARIATVSADGQPDVAPVNFEFDGEYFYVGGLTLARTFKYKNVLKNPKVSIVFDDFENANPWRPRGLKAHGTADIVSGQGRALPGENIRIKPEKTWSWGIEEPAIIDGKPKIKASEQ
jgi:pyridoxamine 5'-phosphate oxidase family protein